MNSPRPIVRNPEARRKIITSFFGGMKPQPRIIISSWGDEHLWIPAESSNFPGKFYSRDIPYIAGFVNSAQEPGVHTVVAMWGSQTAKTTGIYLIHYFHIHQDPCSQMMMRPTKDDSDFFVKTRFNPPLMATKVLAELKDHKESTLKGFFFRNGAWIAFCGSNSVTDASGKSVRIVSFDEVDRFETSTEGDIIEITKKRMATAHNRLMIITATPKDDGTSTVQHWWNLSDKRKYFVPCPKCGHKQTLYWSKETVVWDTDPDGTHHPETARYLCEECHEALYDDDINDMVKNGEWIATAPFNGIAGFGELPEFYAPWKKLGETVQDFLNTHDDPDKLRVWVNTALGQPWKEPGEALEVADVFELRERYDPIAPAGSGIVTGFVDVQDDRLEVLTKAWGRGEESWALERKVFHGDTSIIPESLSMPGQLNMFDRRDNENNPWCQLDEFYNRTYQHASGVQIPISVLGIDTGGHRADQVYTYVKMRQHRGVRGTKGDKNPFKQPISPPSTSTRSKAGRKYKIKLFMIGTQALKDTVAARLRHTLAKKQDERSGPAVYHYPDTEDFPYEFFEQLTAEKKVKRKVGGRLVKMWENIKNARNEGLDLEVGNLAVLRMKCPNAQALAARCEMYDKYLKTNLGVKKEAEKTDQQIVVQASPQRRRRILSKGISDE